jgi:hypothetical protein
MVRFKIGRTDKRVAVEGIVFLDDQDGARDNSKPQGRLYVKGLIVCVRKVSGTLVSSSI